MSRKWICIFSGRQIFQQGVKEVPEEALDATGINRRLYGEQSCSLGIFDDFSSKENWK